MSTNNEEKGYNGWTNYETWNVKLWIDNEEGSYNYWNEQAREIATEPSYQNEYMTRKERIVHQLAEQLKDEHEQMVYDNIPEKLHASFIMDLMNASLGEVNWKEIAENLIDTALENNPELLEDPVEDQKK